MSFTSQYVLEDIKQKFSENKIHLAKEALVITIAKIANRDFIPKPVLVLPICSHDIQGLDSILKTIINEFEMANYGSNIINIATDGDLARRKMLNSNRFMMIDEDLLQVFSNIPLFVKSLLFGKYGVDFDAKHLIKRVRGILISTTRQITLIEHSINRSHIELFLPSLSAYLNPKDY
jgi:hypothetical protein